MPVTVIDGDRAKQKNQLAQVCVELLNIQQAVSHLVD